MKIRPIVAVVSGVLVFLTSEIIADYIDDNPPVTCNDGWPSISIGIQGACSWHGGVKHESHFGRGLVQVIGWFAGIWTIGALLDPPKRDTQKKEHDKLTISKIDTKPSEVVCPVCGAPMRLRTASRGKHKGNRFWGCSRYPTCRGIVQYHDKIGD